MTDKSPHSHPPAGDPAIFGSEWPPEPDGRPTAGEVSADAKGTGSPAPRAAAYEALTFRLAPVRLATAQAMQKASILLGKVGDAIVGKDDGAGNQYAGYLSRSILLEEAPPPRNARAIVATILGALVLFVVWASVSQLDERAVAVGEILPVNFVQPVQHLEGGIVAAVLVVEGQEVARGELLIQLDKTAPSAELESLRARYAALSLQVARLNAFGLGETPDFEAAAPGYYDLIADQTRIYKSQIESWNAQSSVIRSQITELTSQGAGMKAQREALEREVVYAEEEVAMRKDLMAKGLTSRVVLLNTQRLLARAQGQLAEIGTDRARTRAEIAGTRERLLELEGRLKTDALSEMGRIAGEREQVGEQLARLVDRVARTAIKAPISGLVKGLSVTSPGGVIGPGQVILEVVPNERELIAEVRISPRDVGHVKPGSEAIIKIDTFNYARYGGITGSVKQVSATTFRDEEGNPYFRGLVTLERDYVGPDPNFNRITPGMTLVADIKTGEKSLIGYLMRPVYNTLSDSFGER